MILTIDNLDGLGAVDYSAAVDTSAPLEIVRTLNAPSVLKGLLCVAGSALATPVRRARILATAASGAVLFSGYLTVEPVALYAGEASPGAVYRLALSAVSDEWLLDKQSAGSTVGLQLGATGASLINQLAARLAAGALSSSSLTASRTIGALEPAAAATWSAHAGAVASATYSAYRALEGVLTLSGVSSTQHALSDGDGSLSIAGLRTASVRELANDVTVTGAEEPSAYWTELFTGDGTTTVFDLLGQPDAPNAGKLALLSDPFNEPTLNLNQWQLTDPGSHLSLTSAGLTCSGGSGLDGQTALTAWDPLELGGTIVLELDGVLLSAGSAGVLGGLYSGATEQANCFAGFNIRQAGGETLATPLVNGVETGTSLTVLSGHSYTLRLRLHCPEMIRVRQSYYALVDGVVEQFGSGTVAAPVALVFEARDNGAASNTPASILYDGTVTSSPAQASVVAINSLSLVGSMAAVTLNETGSCWITSRTSSSTYTRLIGTAAQGADCSVTSSAGHVTFFAGRVPAAGETITVQYRGRRRSVARLADPASIAAEAAGGAVGTARWLGHVVSPPARSEEDCENAAQAILSFATSRAAAVSGTYTATHPPTGDIWPGDTLAFTTTGDTTSVIARTVTLSTQGAAPEALTYKVAFANDWAEGLGIRLSETIATDVFLPALALDLASGAIPSHVLANLQQMTVTGPTSGFLTVDAGLDPPAGGGFEVRRRDGGFGVGTAATSSGDLVLRSPVRGFSIPIVAAEELFFVRMYDASTPPLSSRFSAAIVCHQAGS